MKLSSVLLSILITFAFAQCDSSKKSSGNESSSKENFKSPPEPKPAPAPGSAVVRCKIVSIDSTSGNTAIVQLKLNEVEAYGAGTPQLGTGQPLNVGIAKSEISKYKKMMEANSMIQAVLSSRQNQTLEGMGNKGPAWSMNSATKAN